MLLGHAGRVGQKGRKMRWLRIAVKMVIVAVYAAPFVLWVGLFAGLINASGNTRLLLQISILISVATWLVRVAHGNKGRYVSTNANPAVEKRGVKKSLGVKPDRVGEDGYGPHNKYPAGSWYSGRWADWERW